MATKILGTKLEYNDLQVLLGLAKDAIERRIITGLFGYQLKMINVNGLQGIDNCKQLHNTWLEWITTGCHAEDISPRRHKHGFKAKLQHAQRLYTKYVQEADLKSARRWRDAVTTVLRSYQVCGPSDEDMQKMWVDSIKSNITEPMTRNCLIALLRGFAGHSSRYNEPCDAQDVYNCALSIKSYFDTIERTPFDQRKGFYKNLSSFVPDLKPDDYSLLIKKGPHKQNNQTIVSIFGEALDVHALTAHVADCFKVNPDEVFVDGSTDSELVSILTVPGSIDLMTLVNKLNEALLDNYKFSKFRRKDVDYNISYSPQIPQGEVPTNILVAPGRTVLLQDKAGKTRPISIATYTVNNALAPLHKQLFRTLRRIRQDSTDQNRGIQHIIELTKQSDRYICSADLSSATDRLPVNLQAYILYRVLKLSRQAKAQEIANAWYQIMTGTEFLDPVDQTLFRYGAGQPMGVYTSWPMLALTNHIMIRAAYLKASDKSLDYLVCGDDTVITSKEAFKYYECWMNALGVKINRSKSHICEANDPIKVAEFCKRLAVNGEIVSSESPKVLIRASRDQAYLPAALECIHSMCGPLSKKKFASLVNISRLERRKLSIPFRYGGWNQINSEPFHEVLLKDNFIFLYIYKKMRAMVSALETKVSVEAADDQRSIDQLSTHANHNPLRQAEKDWRLMGRKVYTPIALCQDMLRRYELFITGELSLNPSELVELVKETFDSLNKCLIPLNISSKDDNYSKSKLAITQQRIYTRTMRNLSSGNVHTYSLGVRPISIDIRYTDDPIIPNPKDLVITLDSVMFT